MWACRVDGEHGLLLFSYLCMPLCTCLSVHGWMDPDGLCIWPKSLDALLAELSQACLQGAHTHMPGRPSACSRSVNHGDEPRCSRNNAQPDSPAPSLVRLLISDMTMQPDVPGDLSESLINFIHSDSPNMEENIITQRDSPCKRAARRKM